MVRFKGWLGSFLPARGRACTPYLVIPAPSLEGGPEGVPRPCRRQAITRSPPAAVQSWGAPCSGPCSGPARRALGRPPREGPRPGSLCLRRKSERPNPARRTDPAPSSTSPSCLLTTSYPTHNRESTEPHPPPAPRSPLPWSHQIPPRSLSPHPQPCPAQLCRTGSRPRRVQSRHFAPGWESAQRSWLPRPPPAGKASREPSAEVCGRAEGVRRVTPAPCAVSAQPRPLRSRARSRARFRSRLSNHSPRFPLQLALHPPPGSIPYTWPHLPRGLTHLSASFSLPMKNWCSVAPTGLSSSKHCGGEEAEEGSDWGKEKGWRAGGGAGRTGVGEVRVSALRKGAAHAPWDKPMRRKLGRGDLREAGRLPTGGRAPEASRKTDAELRLPPLFFCASQIQWSPTPPSDPWHDFLPRSLSWHMK